MHCRCRGTLLLYHEKRDLWRITLNGIDLSCFEPDDQRVPIQMEQPLRNWNSYNARPGRDRSDLVVVEGCWGSYNRFFVMKMDDLGDFDDSDSSLSVHHSSDSEIDEEESSESLR